MENCDCLNYCGDDPRLREGKVAKCKDYERLHRWDAANLSVDELRPHFEAWITAPPYEYSVERYGARGAWPGGYRSIKTHIAWDAYQEATRRLLGALRGA